jgi:putative ABC transport system permease protein
MVKNYFKIAWRNLIRNKAFSIINIIGLTMGIAGAILIFEWVQNELSFDQFHTNKDTLYKVWNRNTPKGPIYTWDVTSAAIAPALKQQFPEVKAVARAYWPTSRLFNFADKGIKATGLDVDKPFLTMFSFPLVEGDATHALDDVKSVVLTQTLARKIFGNQDPIGKILKIDDKDPYKVSGVMKDLPNNTQFDFEYLVSLAARKQTATDETRWNTNSYNTYIQLQPDASIDRVNQKIKDIVLKHAPQTEEEVFLHPIGKWHLYSRFKNGKVVGGRIETVHLLFIIACLILLIACINFMNLSTAQSEKRAKEVGLRKTIGANRFTLIGQFLSESILIAFIAGIIALLIVQLCLPTFNHLTDKKLVVEYGNPTFWLTGVGFILITGVLAGSYPAFFLSAFQPVSVFKGLFKGKNRLLTPRKLLVVIQFTIAIVLIVSTLIIYKQIKYTQERDSGYVQNKLLQHPITGDIGKNYELIKNDLINQGIAAAVSKTSMKVTVDGSSSSGLHWGDNNPEQEKINFTQFASTGDFVKTMGLKLIAGRDIDLKNFPTDSESVLLNKTAIDWMKLKEPIGQTIKAENKTLKIVGVFKDFIIGSPYKSVNPMVVYSLKNWYYGNILIRLNDQNPVSKSLKAMEAIFKKYNPAYPFEYQFVDQEYGQKFKEEERTGSLAMLFAGLTIAISCLGLFGLAAYMAENRNKEIGIRKVLGASVINLTKLVTKDFVALVFVAIIIATPIGWFAMNKWLQDFTYRIHISWLTFLTAGLLAIAIAVLTISFQAIKAALANPVKSLRSE